MSYIDKNSSTVVSSRLTQKGRELLSVGLLNFATFKLGDSEIDYTTLGDTNSYDITLSNVMRAVANQPEFKTFVLPSDSSTLTFSNLPTLSPIILNTITQAPEKGFFTTGGTGVISYTARTATDYTLQPHVSIPLSGVTGTTIQLRQSGSYGSITYEPTTGDLVFVKMANDTITGQIEGEVDKLSPVPYLWFKIESVNSGTLSGDTLSVEFDRTFAEFSSGDCQAIVYPSGNQFTDGGLYSGGTVWNQNNVWSSDIPGVSITSKGFEDYASKNYIGSKEYFGYTSEITDVTNFKDSISIIHYSNVQSCTNNADLIYGQKFYVDTDTDEAPILKIPTLMWHRDSGGTEMGHKFTISGDTIEDFVTLGDVDTKVSYHPLSDEYGNNVGRVFPQYKTFTIDDQELVAALSYKSNRNWTLPKLSWDVKTGTDGVLKQTETLYVTYLLTSNTGYTTGLHCQNISSADFSTVDDCADCLGTTAKQIDITFPSGQLAYMNTTGTTGWYADTLYMLVQKVSKDENGVPQKPSATGWLTIDVTASIDSHTVGQRIEPANLENSTFNLTQTLYDSGTIYDLSTYITLPTTVQTKLNFGDERFFFGSLDTKTLTTKYRTKFNITLPPTRFNTSNNPTWVDSGQNVHVSEVGIYDADNNLVAVGKNNLPIEKAINSTIILEMAFDL